MKIRDGIVKKSWCLAIIFLFVGASVVPHVGSEKIELEWSGLLNSTQQNEVHVNNDYNNTHPGWNVTHFDNIQDGIDHVGVGETVSVHNGTYYENVVIDKKKLTLKGVDEDEWGNDTDGSIIDGNGIGNVVFIRANEVKITEFTIINSGPGNGAGIYSQYRTGITIALNVIKENICGIYLYECSGPLFVEKNNISYNDYGIWLNGGGGITIGIYNHIENNRLFGIVLEGSYRNTISSNEISNNGKLSKIGHGMGLFRSFANVIEHNNFRDNGKDGTRHVTIENCISHWNGNHYNPRNWHNLGKWGIIIRPYIILVFFHFKVIPYLSVPVLPQFDWLAERDPYTILSIGCFET